MYNIGPEQEACHATQNVNDDETQKASLSMAHLSKGLALTQWLTFQTL